MTNSIPPQKTTTITTRATLVSFCLFEEIMISCLKLSLIDQLETA